MKIVALVIVVSPQINKCIDPYNNKQICSNNNNYNNNDKNI